MSDILLKVILAIVIAVPLCAAIIYCIIQEVRCCKDLKEYKKEDALLAKRLEKVNKRIDFLRMQIRLIDEGRSAECVSLNQEDEEG